MINIRYRATDVDGTSIFYREAGSPGAPKLLLLHGFPSAGHMFRDLIPLLADRYHIIAPDLPGFGKSDMPKNGNTFDSIAQTIDRFTEVVGFDRYAVYIFDYGAPTGLRLAVKHPERITAIISQNGNAYEEGLSDGWNPIQAYWKEPSQANRDALRDFLKPEATVWQYTHGVPDTAAVSPDGYSLDNFYLARPGVADVQLDLFGDYKSNVALYPAFQAYFRKHQPPLLAVWGSNDPFFLPAGAEAFKRDIPKASREVLRYRSLCAGDPCRPRSRPPSVTSCPAKRRDRCPPPNNRICRHRHRRQPGHRPGHRRSSGARFLGRGPGGAQPRPSGRDGRGGESCRRGRLDHRCRSFPTGGRPGGGGQDHGCVRPDRRPSQYRRRGAADRSFRDDRRTVGEWPGAEAPWRAGG